MFKPKGNHCHSETSASVDGASGILDPSSRNFFKDKQPPKSVELHLIIYVSSSFLKLINNWFYSNKFAPISLIS